MRKTTLLVACLALGASASAAGPKKESILPKEVVMAIARDAYDGTLPPGLGAERWAHVVFDLNHDGKPDYVIAQQDPGYCGSGGCSFLIIVSSPNGYRSAYSGGNFYTECWASKQMSHGFADLIFNSPAYGEDYLHLLRYDGKEYREIKFH